MVKRALEFLLYNSGAAGLARALARGRTIVVAYHNIVGDDAEVVGERVLHLTRRKLRRQLDMLADTHDVVPLMSALEEPVAAGERPRAVITFDDAYHGAVTLGVDELVRRDLPATIFVAPGYVGGRSFWWDAFGSSERGDDRDERRRRALEELGGRDEEIRERFRMEGLEERSVPELQRCASEPELERAAARPGITFAPHSWTHPNLTCLDEGELRREMTRPLEWLESRFPESTIPCIAYPYGLSSDRVERLAREAGYTAAFCLAEGTWLPPEPESRYSLPRYPIARDTSRWGFGLRVAGF